MEQIYPDLLITFLSGECSTEQKTQVQQWLAASEENRAQFEELKQVWQLSAQAYPPELELNTDAAWNKVSQKINLQETKTISLTSGFQYKYLYRIAAVLLPFLAVGIYYFFMNQQPKQLTLISKETLTSTILADGTHINLNYNTDLNYPETFKGNTREISLSGEAFLSVSHDVSKPFVVHTQAIDVVVLGTEFNVKAYPNQDLIEVYVQSGRVAVYNTNNEGKRMDSVILDPGYKGIYNARTLKLEKLELSDDVDLFWIHKTLNFNNTELSEVFEVLQKVYGITVRPKDASLLKLRITTSFQNQSVNRIMAIIGETLELKIVNTGDTYDVDVLSH